MTVSKCFESSRAPDPLVCPPILSVYSDVRAVIKTDFQSHNQISVKTLVEPRIDVWLGPLSATGALCQGRTIRRYNLMIQRVGTLVPMPSVPLMQRKLYTRIREHVGNSLP